MCRCVFAGHRTGKGIMSNKEVLRARGAESCVLCHKKAEVGPEGRKRNNRGIMGGDGSQVGEMRAT